MKILVPIQLVPDLVEELVIAQDGKRLDLDATRWIISEFDDHAIEQAILLKEKIGGEVTVIAPDFEGTEDVLYQALAKGADQVVKLSGDFQSELNTHALARLVVHYLQTKSERPDLILTGVQANSSLDGSLGPLLAAYLDLPFVDCVAQTEIEDQKITVRKEYPGGLTADWSVALPVVLGIQAANTPPRYVPISKMRLAMKTGSIATEEVGELDLSGAVDSTRMYTPEADQRAQMIDGDVDQVAEKLVALFKELGVL
ncbi:MAG: electron transfer flavoprotein subunit beta/FixA family protein [Chloroflexi bacterium]|nr:electron transfer flavoprotein subunit beta/FixA family protein [Chloroflexota bacterium]